MAMMVFMAMMMVDGHDDDGVPGVEAACTLDDSQDGHERWELGLSGAAEHCCVESMAGSVVTEEAAEQGAQQELQTWSVKILTS